MAFQLKELKSSQKTIEHKTDFTPHVVVGRSYFALNAFFQLVETYGRENVTLIAYPEITQSSLFFQGPSLFRLKGDERLFSSLFPHLPVQKEASTPLFYKDQKFRPFGGRSRPMVLTKVEEFFTRPFLATSFVQGFQEELQRLLSLMKEGDFQGRVQNTPVQKIKRIQKAQEVDDPKNFALTLASGDLLTCTHLYWEAGLWSFMERFEDENKKRDQKSGEKSLTTELYEEAFTLRPVPFLFIQFDLKKSLFDSAQTFFIPESQTYEHGYFIGESSIKSSEGAQKIRFMISLERGEESDSMGAEDLGDSDLTKKVRTLKSTLKRIFPHFPSSLLRERIFMSNHTLPLWQSDDELWSRFLEQNPHLTFLGLDSPLQVSSQGLPLSSQGQTEGFQTSHLYDRGLKSFEAFQSSLN